MSKLDEIKKLKERIEELEFVKDFQQDIIADMELITGVDMSKKSLPKIVAKEIRNSIFTKYRFRINGNPCWGNSCCEC
jgi:transposase